jgi:hypothetical protein
MSMTELNTTEYKTRRCNRRSGRNCHHMPDKPLGHSLCDDRILVLCIWTYNMDTGHGPSIQALTQTLHSINLPALGRKKGCVRRRCRF